MVKTFFILTRCGNGTIMKSDKLRFKIELYFYNLLLVLSFKMLTFFCHVNKCSAFSFLCVHPEDHALRKHAKSKN